MSEPSREEEGGKKLEMRPEWSSRNRILEESMKTAYSENEILKREVDQLEVQLLAARTKQASPQVEELKLSLIQAKKEMEVLRTETKERLQQSEQLEKERREQDLKLKKTQTEIEGYKRAASRSSGKSEMFYS